MRIESFHIQGYKSLADVKVEGLSDINVFYGLNGVGKSNIFEALALCFRFLKAPGSNSFEQFEAEVGPMVFRFGSDNSIRLKLDILLDQLDFPIGFAPSFEATNQIKITRETEINLPQREIKTQVKILGYKRKQRYLNSQEDILEYLPRFLVIGASRRFQVEQSGKGKRLGVISDHNLKQALFYAYLSSDLQQKARLAAIKRILAESPFSLGELDVALDPITDTIDIGFVRPEGRLPLESLGTGAQQLLLVLGQIFLNDYPIIAIEEPEMNLSPQYQQYLLVALRQLMQDPAVKLNQLFISTHSPYFEFEENFFDVSLDEQGRTQVARLPIEQRERYFPDTQVGPETGARLNSLNQVKLYDGVIKDLGLQRGDLVLFVKNDSGRWEIRPEDEIIQELDEIFDREKNQ